MNLSTEKKIRDLENRLVVTKGEGVGWTGNLGIFPLTPRNSAPRKKRKKGHTKQLRLTRHKCFKL